MIAPPGQGPHYRDRFQSCPILASVDLQYKTLAWGLHSQNTGIKHFWTFAEGRRKTAQRLEIYEHEQGVLAAGDITVLACAGRMELLSIIFIYTHTCTHTREDWGAGFWTHWRGAYFPSLTKWNCSLEEKEKKGTAGAVWSARPTLCFMFSAKAGSSVIQLIVQKGGILGF